MKRRSFLPAERADIIVDFADFAARKYGHCHILDHEDNDMMRPYSPTW